jgi:hypothetical protein
MIAVEPRWLRSQSMNIDDHQLETFVLDSVNFSRLNSTVNIAKFRTAAYGACEGMHKIVIPSEFHRLLQCPKICAMLLHGNRNLL